MTNSQNHKRANCDPQQLKIIEADLARPDHQQAVVDLIDSYASDAMGNGRSLPTEVRENLVPGLRQHPTTLVLLAYHGEQTVGIAVCFVGFSTFAAKPLINIHDLAVRPEFRHQGVGRRLLEHVESKAHELGCCKLTLEVFDQNQVARTLYRNVGFKDSMPHHQQGSTLFMQKRLQGD